MTECATPAIKLTSDTTGKWRVDLRDFPGIEKALGREVVNAFCRCFIHTDRLTSMISCIHASAQQHGRDSTAHGRDHLSMVWFTIGTLRELAVALRATRAALAKRRWLEPESAHWVTLRKLEDRWESDEYYRTIRNVAAFHVNPEIIDEGLSQLVKERVVELARGEGEKNIDSTLSLGDLTLLTGLDLSSDRFRALISTVSADHIAASNGVQIAFYDAADAAGVSCG